MCGILGVFGKLKQDETRYKLMLHALRHRGPDDHGVTKGERYFLGHRRLSIIDPEKGHQPLNSQDGRIDLVCNGEIYNFKDLKKDLAENYLFSTNSDSEVIIPTYLRKREYAARHLDGMFSIIISDPDSFYVARDPIGIKPLYYGTGDGCVYFSSEVKALINVAERIHEFPNGHYFGPQIGFKPYYRLPETEYFIADKDRAIGIIHESLRRSVKKRLMSDVPVGVFLSGGLDSSIVAALMKEQISKLHSFSVGLPDSPDLKAARIVAEHLGTTHHEHIYTEAEMTDVLPEVIYYLESYDAALIRSAIPCYFVSRLASQFVKVVLSGEGSDELFAGYSYFSDHDEPKALHNETIRILNGLHNINLQRVDRMTMAHGLEGRVPFLDIEFIETVLSIDANLKMYGTFGIEKWLLRKAFEGMLPKEIVWRDKMEFAQGCGSSTVFQQKAEYITDEEIKKAKRLGAPISSKEELLYYNMFRRFFDHPDAENLTGKWLGDLH